MYSNRSSPDQSIWWIKDWQASGTSNQPCNHQSSLQTSLGSKWNPGKSWTGLTSFPHLWENFGSHWLKCWDSCRSIPNSPCGDVLSELTDTPQIWSHSSHLTSGIWEPCQTFSWRLKVDGRSCKPPSGFCPIRLTEKSHSKGMDIGFS